MTGHLHHHSSSVMNPFLIFCLLASVHSQLTVETNPADLDVAGDSVDNNENLTKDFESEKLDHRRRRRRKMLSSSTPTPALRMEPTEPRITVS